MSAIAHRRILDTRIDATNYRDATRRITGWAEAGEARYVCVTSVHGVIEAHENPALQPVWNESDLNTPDGMPLVWGLRTLGVPAAERVYGPDLTLHVCRAAAEEGIPIGLYGGTTDSLNDFSAFLEQRFPGIDLACQISPPFRTLSDREDEEYVRQIKDSGARILLVGIGCPKQEKWMAAHKDRLQTVMIGVGAAFDFHSGRVSQAPNFIQQSGFEWLFRLLSEPRRLWSRYSHIVPKFIGAFGKQLTRHHLFGSGKTPSKAGNPTKPSAE